MSMGKLPKLGNAIENEVKADICTVWSSSLSRNESKLLVMIRWPLHFIQPNFQLTGNGCIQSCCTKDLIIYTSIRQPFCLKTDEVFISMLVR